MTDKTDAPGILKYIIPRLGEIIFIAVFMAVIGLGPRLMNVDGDLGRHLTLGNYILDSKTIPINDIFSFSKAGDSLTPHEWLSDVLFALVYRYAKLDGVVWMTAIVLAVTMWLIYSYSSKISGMSILAAAAAILGAAASSLHWLTRPHIFTILLTIIWTIELDRIRLGKKKYWFTLPIIMLVWVNLHGAFFAGLLLWLCYFVGLILDRGTSWNDIKPFLWVGITSFLITLVNPDGFGIWKTGFEFLGNQYLVSHTAEYLPPNFQNSSFWPFLLVLMGSLILFAFSKRRLAIPHIFIIGGWSLLALYSARNIPLYIAASLPFICSAGAGLLIDNNSIKPIKDFIAFQDGLNETEKQLKGGVWATLVVFIVAVMLVGGTNLDFDQQGNEFSTEVFPVAAVDWMEDKPLSGNGFNYFPWGGYLLYRLWPENLVFIDGQTDFYGEKLTREYEKIITLGKGWQTIIEEYQINWVLMPVDSILIDELRSSSDWEIVFEDNTAAAAVLKMEK